MQIDEDVFISHYGKKGMKWGVRKKNARYSTASAVNKFPQSKRAGDAGVRLGQTINAATGRNPKALSKSDKARVQALYNKRAKTTLKVAGGAAVLYGARKAAGKAAFKYAMKQSMG